MGAAILKLDIDRKLLNTDVTSMHPVDLKSVEPVQKHVNKCDQRIIPEHNATTLLKLRHELHTTITVWARRNLTRGRWFKMAQILTLNRNYNPRQYRDRRCDVRAFQFSPSHLRIWLPVIWIISVYLWYQVYFVIIIFEILVTFLSIKYLKNIFWW